MFDDIDAGSMRAAHATVRPDRLHDDSFLELMFVVVIISAVVVLAIPPLQLFSDKVRLLETITLSLGERNDAVVFNAVAGHMPETLMLAGRRDPLGTNVKSADWRDGELVFSLHGAQIERLSAAHYSKSAMTLAFRPAVAPVSGSLVWLCGYREPPAGFGAAPPRHTNLPSMVLLHMCRPGASN